MDARSHICLTCQIPLRLDVAYRSGGESSEPDKKNENEIVESMSTQTRNLMKLISDAQTPHDAPVCKECSDSLLKEMDARLAFLDEECLCYKKFCDELKENHSSSNLAEMKTQLQNLQDEELALQAQLAKLAAEEEQADKELQKRRKEYEEANDYSSRLWQKYRDNLSTFLAREDELKKLSSEVCYAEQQQRKLADTNAIDLCFHIWLEDKIGEINGFRLGTLPDVKVDWMEINAAFGQVVLLIEVLYERLGIQHPELVPVSMGSHSVIKMRKNGSDGETFPVYGHGTPCSGSNPLDGGIKKVLKLVEYLQTELKLRNENFKMIYTMGSEGFIDNGVKYKAVMILNSEVRWTRAMAMLLMNLKCASEDIGISPMVSRRNSPSRKRRSLADCAEERTTQPGLKNWLIWLAISTTLFFAAPPPLFEDVDEFVPFFDKMEPNNFVSAPKPFFDRPMGLRWRDDSRMMQEVSNAYVMPVLTEHRSVSPFGGRRFASPSRPTTSSMATTSANNDSPSLEDIDLIDVLWRSDIAIEKGSRHVALADQYECDLQTLTEKSTIMVR
ncbi:unnamed protein product [Caenorhabditis bovis]|uniref:Autophagy-related protein 6 n=1 Tax=Caenorhabditis bovis TaxID=2654633 RepID=A0A8S1F2V0_9PELO|nr:unnamed protein product [Caenorhabditis bovis]